MSAMENRDEVLQLLERFTRLKQKEIPRELEDYLSFVARTGDTVYPWAAVKYFFRTKLSHVIMDFHDNTPSIADLPKCPNVDPFCYDRMKRTLLSRMESFNSAPFTIQRICELLNEPRKHYTRIDKFMRAVEKNILVVSTQEPGRRRSDSENGDSLDSIVNGDLEVNVDIEMDNEAFGIDTGEMAPAAGVAALGPSVNITTPAHAEEVPPTMEPEAEEHDTEKEQAPDDEPKLACSDGNEDDLKPDETVPPEVNGSDKHESETTVDAPVPTDPVDVQHSASETSQLDQPTVTPTTDVVDPVADVVHEQEELEEPVTSEQPTSSIEPVPESLDASKSPEPTITLPTETESQTVDDGEPKAKMAKLSQEEPEEAETIAPQPITEEPTAAAESAEPVTAALVATSTEELSESDVVSVFASSESLQTAESDTTSTSCNISSDEPEASSAISIPSTTSTDSNQDTSPTTVEDVAPSVLETPAELEQSEADESANQVESAEPTPSEPSEAVSTEEEQLIKTTVLETPEEVPEQPQPTAQVVADEMETVPSGATTAAAAVVPENVMATDDEDQPVVPMAADATETTSKPDENAMDIDESSVEPMDQ
ncbi:serine/threonine-protein phosphatase 4 regulatory subunit 2 [Aedes albopictus]|uniref:Serine/threonine-protein phosphatase 4 regulatory subunit 2 n=1 Tax=Aedes albopictus TaxID=7160 RepID=A0ABM1Y7F7_AEDAL